MTIIDLTANFENGTLNQVLMQLPEKLEAAGLRAIDEGADLMVDIAKTIVRVDTGSLQQSIRKQHTRNRVISVRAGGYVTNPKTGKRVNYAHWVEKNYPYMRPAYEIVKPHIKDLIIQYVKAST